MRIIEDKIEGYDIVPKLMDVFFRFRRFRHRSPVYGLKHSETRLLFVMDKRAKAETGISISELSAYLKVTSPTITQRINALEEQGYVLRIVDPEDRRSIKVFFTEKGKETIKKAKESFYDLFAQLAEHLGLEKSTELVNLLSESFDFFSRSMFD